MINECLIEPKIGDDHKPVVWRNIDGAGVGLRLLPAMPDVLDKGGLLSKATVFPDPQNRNAAAAVTGGKHVLAGLIDREIAGTSTPAGHRVQHMQFARRGIDGVSGNVRLVITRRSNGGWIFAGRIQKTMIGRDSQEGWIADLRGQFGLGQISGCRTEPADVNPFAVTLAGGIPVQHVLEAGVSPGVQKVFLCLTRCRTAGTKDEREG